VGGGGNWRDEEGEGALCLGTLNTNTHTRESKQVKKIGGIQIQRQAIGIQNECQPMPRDDEREVSRTNDAEEFDNILYIYASIPSKIFAMATTAKALGF
jgi:hypothetical protein